MCEKYFIKRLIKKKKKKDLLEDLKMLQELYKMLIFLQLTKYFYKIPNYLKYLESTELP